VGEQHTGHVARCGRLRRGLRLAGEGRYLVGRQHAGKEHGLVQHRLPALPAPVAAEAHLGLERELCQTGAEGGRRQLAVDVEEHALVSSPGAGHMVPLIGLPVRNGLVHDLLGARGLVGVQEEQQAHGRCGVLVHVQQALLPRPGAEEEVVELVISLPVEGLDPERQAAALEAEVAGGLVANARRALDITDEEPLAGASGDKAWAALGLAVHVTGRLEGVE